MSTFVEKTYEGWQVVEDGITLKEFSTQQEAKRLSLWLDNIEAIDDKLAGALNTLLGEFAELQQVPFEKILECYREYGGKFGTKGQSSP